MHIVEVNENDFNDIVIQSSLPVLVDFWAEWCGSCKGLLSVLEEVASELEGKAIIAKVNVDHNPELAQKYGLRALPTMIFFKDGQNMKTLVGNQPKNEIIKSLEELA